MVTSSLAGPGYVPQRGDIIWLQFNPQAGHEQSGHRPALVLSSGLYNERSSLSVVCPITSREKQRPYNVSLPEHLLDKPSWVIADQVRSLDLRSRQAKFLAKAPANALKLVTRYAAGIVSGM